MKVVPEGQSLTPPLTFDPQLNQLIFRDCEDYHGENNNVCTCLKGVILVHVMHFCRSNYGVRYIFQPFLKLYVILSNDKEILNLFLFGFRWKAKKRSLFHHTKDSPKTLPTSQLWVQQRNFMMLQNQVPQVIYPQLKHVKWIDIYPKYWQKTC